MLDLIPENFTRSISLRPDKIYDLATNEADVHTSELFSSILTGFSSYNNVINNNHIATDNSVETEVSENYDLQKNLFPLNHFEAKINDFKSLESYKIPVDNGKGFAVNNSTNNPIEPTEIIQNPNFVNDNINQKPGNTQIPTSNSNELDSAEKNSPNEKTGNSENNQTGNNKNNLNKAEADFIKKLNSEISLKKQEIINIKSIKFKNTSVVQSKQILTNLNHLISKEQNENKNLSGKISKTIISNDEKNTEDKLNSAVQTNENIKTEENSKLKNLKTLNQISKNPKNEATFGTLENQLTDSKNIQYKPLSEGKNNSNENLKTDNSKSISNGLLNTLNINQKPKNDSKSVTKDIANSTSENGNIYKDKSANISLVNNNGTIKDHNHNKKQGVIKISEEKNGNKGLKNVENLINNNSLNKNLTTQTKTIANSFNSNNIETYTNIKIEDFFNKTFEVIKKMPDNTIQTARLVLRPETLGTVFVKIQLLKGSVQLKIETNTKETANLLESQLPALKEKMSQQGLNIEKSEFGFREDDGRNNFHQKTGKESNKENRNFIKDFISSFKDKNLAEETA